MSRTRGEYRRHWTVDRERAVRQRYLQLVGVVFEEKRDSVGKYLLGDCGCFIPCGYPLGRMVQPCAKHRRAIAEAS